MMAHELTTATHFLLIKLNMHQLFTLLLNYLPQHLDWWGFL